MSLLRKLLNLVEKELRESEEFRAQGMTLTGLIVEKTNRELVVIDVDHPEELN